MIVTRLLGGLGNQMFQYAYGLYLAELTQQECYLDVSAFESYDLHALAIDNFAITSERLPKSLRKRVPGRFRGTTRVRESLENFLRPLSSKNSAPLTLRREKPFGFRPEYTQPGADLYLDGYWQGEAFFPGMRAKLLQEFQLAQPLSQQSTEVAAQMAECNSVAVHVRRGDYVTDNETARIFRCMDASYYRSCLQDLQQHVNSPKVFLFSNDTDWCLKNLDVGLPFIPVTHNDASTAYEDMHLISQCRHAVIANSSFSWWGAYLGKQQASRRVYRPSPWFNPGSLDGSALGCADWIPEHTLDTGQQRLAG